MTKGNNTTTRMQEQTGSKNEKRQRHMTDVSRVNRNKSSRSAKNRVSKENKNSKVSQAVADIEHTYENASFVNCNDSSKITKPTEDKSDSGDKGIVDITPVTSTLDKSDPTRPLATIPGTVDSVQENVVVKKGPELIKHQDSGINVNDESASETSALTSDSDTSRPSSGQSASTGTQDSSDFSVRDHATEAIPVGGKPIVQTDEKAGCNNNDIDPKPQEKSALLGTYPNKTDDNKDTKNDKKVLETTSAVKSTNNELDKQVGKQEESNKGNINNDTKVTDKNDKNTKGSNLDKKDKATKPGKTLKDDTKKSIKEAANKSKLVRIPGKSTKKAAEATPLIPPEQPPSRSEAREKWMALKVKRKEIIRMASPRPNGTLARTDSLTVPDGTELLERRDSSSPRSLRRGSSRSIDSKVSTSIDLSKIATNINETDEKKDIKSKQTLAAASDNYIKNAIPHLPLPVAILLLMLNIVLPGIGTMLSGLCILCCGKPRVQTKDDHVMLTVCINMWVGMAQLFTITFMLVGWVWSLAWGIYMVILAVEKRKEEKKHRQKELQAKALTALNSQIRPWTLRT